MGLRVLRQLLLGLCAFGAMTGLAWAKHVHHPGDYLLVTPESLPAPFTSPSSVNPAKRIERPYKILPIVPEGFKVNLFAEGLEHARWLHCLPNGDILVAESNAGRIILLRDLDQDGKADVQEIVASGFERPHGLDFHDGWLYIGTPKMVWRLRYSLKDHMAGGLAQPVLKAGSLGRGDGHWTRSVLIDADRDKLYVAIGSRGNVGIEPRVRATIQEFDLKSGQQRPFATGLRNPVGLAFRPGTKDVYTVVNERDGYGDDLVPDFFTKVQEGDFFGWPYAYAGTNPDPRYAGRAPRMVEISKTPDVLFRSHSAPLGLHFYYGTAFPAPYRGNAYVALHGSWNAAKPQGYMVVRIEFNEDGSVKPGYRVFASGFRMGHESPARVWGRPVGITETKDGALLIADDVANVVWRVSYGE